MKGFSLGSFGLGSLGNIGIGNINIPDAGGLLSSVTGKINDNKGAALGKIESAKAGVENLINEHTGGVLEKINEYKDGAINQLSSVGDISAFNNLDLSALQGDTNIEQLTSMLQSGDLASALNDLPSTSDMDLNSIAKSKR